MSIKNIVTLTRYLYIHLKEINGYFLIEDKKVLEKEQNFHDDFIHYARLVIYQT